MRYADEFTELMKSDLKYPLESDSYKMILKILQQYDKDHTFNWEYCECGCKGHSTKYNKKIIGYSMI